VPFLRFTRKRQDESAPVFFLSEFRRKHLFITYCIEKQYTRPLKESPRRRGTYIYHYNAKRMQYKQNDFSIVSGVARVPCALGQEIFLRPSPSTKLTEFELK